MGDATKSLAAEIEAVRNCQTLFLADYAEAQASSEATDRHAAALMAKGLSNAVDRLRAALAEQEKGDA